MRTGTLTFALIVGLATTLPAFAQSDVAAPAAPALQPPPAPVVAAASDLQSVLEVMYADLEKLKQGRAVTTSDIAAVGAGAGLGYLLGGLVTGGFIAPAVSSLVTTAGFAEPTGLAFGSTVATMGTFASAYAGGVAGDALIE